MASLRKRKSGGASLWYADIETTLDYCAHFRRADERAVKAMIRPKS